jgi:hypothetical protein
MLGLEYKFSTNFVYSKKMVTFVTDLEHKSAN